MIFPLSPPMFDLLILSITEQEDSYGYQLSQKIKNVSGVKDSTLYPILRRLQEQHFVETYDEQYQGRNRKYYTITDSGRYYQEELSKEWERYKTIIDDIVKGGTEK